MSQGAQAASAGPLLILFWPVEERHVALAHGNDEDRAGEEAADVRPPGDVQELEADPQAEHDERGQRDDIVEDW